MKLPTDTEIIDWLADQDIISGEFVVGEEETDCISIKEFSSLHNIPLNEALRALISMAMDYEKNSDI